MNSVQVLVYNISAQSDTKSNQTNKTQATLQIVNNFISFKYKIYYMKTK